MDQHGLTETLEEALKCALESKTDDPLLFVTHFLGEKCGIRNHRDKAMRLVGETDPRSSMMQQNLSDAFLSLASQAGEFPSIPTDEFNSFCVDICSIYLMEPVGTIVLPLVHVDSELQAKVSYNDFMCAMNPIVVLFEIQKALRDAFEIFDIDRDGLISPSKAMTLVNQLKWIFQGHGPINVATHMQNAENYFRKHSGYPVEGKLSREKFIEVVLCHICPLSYKSEFWLKES